ncbi:MAG: hypothetical protein ACR2NM_16335 [Bythopirellula sp.]
MVLTLRLWFRWQLRLHYFYLAWQAAIVRNHEVPLLQWTPYLNRVLLDVLDRSRNIFLGVKSNFPSRATPHGMIGSMSCVQQL